MRTKLSLISVDCKWEEPFMEEDCKSEQEKYFKELKYITNIFLV